MRVTHLLITNYNRILNLKAYSILFISELPIPVTVVMGGAVLVPPWTFPFCLKVKIWTDLSALNERKDFFFMI